VPKILHSNIILLFLLIFLAGRMVLCFGKSSLEVNNQVKHLLRGAREMDVPGAPHRSPFLEGLSFNLLSRFSY